jgi:hypothetical protein
MFSAPVARVAVVDAAVGHVEVTGDDHRAAGGAQGEGASCHCPVELLLELHPLQRGVGAVEAQ